MTVGPRDPFTATGDARTICIDRADAVLKGQEYADGTLYEVTVPGGAPFDGVMNSVIGAVPAGTVWLNMRDEGGKLFITFWQANNNY